MNKSFSLCGIGNALLDIQFEVTNEELASYGLAKGQMQLADFSNQESLLGKLASNMPSKSSGGSAANTVIAFSRFGGSAAYMTCLGNDTNGKFYAEEFNSIGIRLAAATIDNEHTGTCIVLITPDSERTMQTFLGASATFGPGNVDERLIAESEWLYLEGYEFSTKSGAEACLHSLEIAKKHSTKVSLTFSDSFITTNFKDELMMVAKDCDLIFCNEAEALTFTGQDSISGAYAQLENFCPGIVITRGGSGSLIKWNSEKYEIPAYETTAIDSTGAGDMFAGAFLYGINSSGSAYKAGHLASYAASRVVSQLGARLNENHRSISQRFL